MDPRSGFSSETRTFHSLKPPIHLPPPEIPLSAAAFALSLRRTFPWPADSTAALVDSATGRSLSYSDFLLRTQTLAANLRSAFRLSKGDSALILCPNSLHTPLLYFSLLSLGVVVSPANPASTAAEIRRLAALSNPSIAFSTSENSHKLRDLRPLLRTILVDSAEFDSLSSGPIPDPVLAGEEIRQSDLAAVLYSSGTTGKVKGVMLTHRNLINMTAGFFSDRAERDFPAVVLYTVPYFHVYGFIYCVKSVGVSDTAVVMERFDLWRMARAVEEMRVSHLMLVPSVLVGLVKNGGKLKAAGFGMSNLERVGCGSAPLGKELALAFKSLFPNVVLSQVIN